MSNERVRQVLAGEIGLAADVLGSATLGRAVLERMRALGLASVDAYSERLEKDRGERAALVEDVVVPETWFFRDGEPFRVIARIVRAWPQGRLLRALSMPCATGEEPFSLVMTLAEEGFDLDRVAVTAIDVSARALERARRALYTRNSFRGDVSLMRARHFRSAPPGPAGEEWQLDDRIRRCVELIQGNALQLSGVTRGPFDVILCRNLLIYLTGDARQRVLTSLIGMLSDEGVLIVGHADLIDAHGHGLQLVGDPAGFAYTRITAAAPAVRESGPMPALIRLPPEPAPRPTPTSANAPRAFARAPTPPPVPREEGPVTRARVMADRGDLAAAATLLLAHIDQLGPDGDAYHLLGMIESARGDRAAAEKYLSRALYCDPSNQATLLQLGLLASQRGDETAAANFRRRAARLRGGKT